MLFHTLTVNKMIMVAWSDIADLIRKGWLCRRKQFTDSEMDAFQKLIYSRACLCIWDLLHACLQVVENLFLSK